MVNLVVAALDLPFPIPTRFDFTPDTTVLALTLAIVFGAGVLFGVAPRNGEISTDNPLLAALERTPMDYVEMPDPGFVRTGTRLQSSDRHAHAQAQQRIRWNPCRAWEHLDVTQQLRFRAHRHGPLDER